MHWSYHINTICKNENKSLHFIHQNLSTCNSNVKATVYLTIVRPLLEYTACVWDPHQDYLICEIEKVQRHAAR